MALILCCVTTAQAQASMPLTEGKSQALFRTGQGRLAFKKEPALTDFPDPRCSSGNESLLQLQSQSQNIIIPLNCLCWKLDSKSGKYVFDCEGVFGATPNPGGVDKIEWKSVGLKVTLKGPNYTAINGPLTFLDARLVVGDADYCARFTSFKDNEAIKISANDTNTACDAFGTPTPTFTNTLTPTLSPTRTPTETPTLTETPTESPTLTATKTPTVTQTPTITDTPTLTPTLTPTNTFTITPTGTIFPTDTPTITQTFTPTHTATQTPTFTATSTPTISATRTPTNTPTQSPTITNTPTNTPAGPPTGFRINSLFIKDPPIYVNDLFGEGSCPGPLNSLIDNAIAGPIGSDAVFRCCTDISATSCEDPERSCSTNSHCTVAPFSTCAGDGYLDLSIVVVFRPLNQAAAGGDLELNFADCTAPLAGTSCTGGDTVQPAAYTNINSGTCLQPIPGTFATGSGFPTINSPSPPCFLTEELNLTFDLDLLQIPLTGVLASITYQGNPATQISPGLLFGFLDETTADNVVIPLDVDLVGGRTLSSLLPGGTGNCKTATPKGPCTIGCRDDRDEGPGGAMGWYFYLNTGASPKVTYTDPAP
jgi:hypothetical protein